MAVIYFDTSALMRRYDRAEPGSARVRTLCRRPTEHLLAVSRLTAVEMASAISRKLRQGLINEAERRRWWRLFRRHWRRQYRVILLDEQAYTLAERLPFRHPLRTYDAVQLATALCVRDLFATTGEFRFCTADRPQADAARTEGLAVELIG